MSQQPRILIVDDEANLRRTLADILTDKGYHVETASTGAEAVARSTLHCYDAVLLDVRLPDASGVEVFRRIQALCPQTRVILLSAYSIDELKRAALAGGAAAFLSKPVDVDAVLRLLPPLDQPTSVSETAVVSTGHPVAPERGGFARLLVVEDDPSQLLTLTDILADEGFAVRPCRTAHEALMAAAEHEHVAAVIDLRLPDQEGTRLVEQLRAVDERIRVIIYTGYGSFGSAKEAVNRGAFAYVEKLGDPAELIGHVHRARAEHVREYASLLEQAVVQRTAALRESESRLLAIVEAVVDAIVVVDELGRIDTFNPAAARLFGWTAEELRGQEVDRLFPPAQRGEHNAHLERARAQGAATPIETIGLRKDGSLVALELGVSVMKVGSRRLFVEILRDLTARKLAEEAHHRLERQMRQVQKMEALGTLAGGVAHDFNNILAGIRGFTDLTLPGLDPDSAEAENLTQVIRLTERAAGLVQQILTFTRQRDRQRTPIDLRKVIKEVLSLVRAMLPATIEIRSTLPETPSIVLADPTELHQVLMNLCGNAAHAMRDRGGVLSLAVSSVEVAPADPSAVGPSGPSPSLRLSVRDTGHGMTAQVRERIFDPFFTTKEAGEGTGMGLSVVLGIVEGLGGRILVESEPDVGTCFDVYLPLVGAQPIRDPNPPSPLVEGKGRLLLIDDEPFILSWASLLLRRLGYEVETSENSVAALQRFRADPSRFDLVVTDQTMPRLSGGELMVELLKLRPDLPVIMISGYSDRIDEDRALALGARNFLPKPFSNTQLADAIHDALQPPPASEGRQPPGAPGR